MFRVRNLFLLAFTLVNVSVGLAQVHFYAGERKCAAASAIEKNLLNAVNRGNESSVRQLLANGADAKMVDDCGNPILTYATLGSRLRIMKLLIDAGADVNAVAYSFQRVPLADGVDTTDPEDRYAVVKVLIDGGANVNALDFGTTVLMKAVSIEDVRLVQLLISAGAKVNAQDEGETAFSRAAVLGNQKLKEILLEAGADPMIGVAYYKKEWGEQAFFQAAADGRVDVVEAMLSNGTATVNMTNSYKATALMRTHDERTVDVLLRAGADVNLRNETGFTALMWAAAAGRTSIVEKLIAAGADVNARGNDGKAVIDLAANDEIERLLKAAGANRKKSPL